MNETTLHTRHQISEASAGTGKTTWITRQAIHLLTSGNVRLDQILFMTYTERATGDLKARLRTAVEKAQLEMPEYRASLQAALDSFDQAHVYTIHGFCQRVLLDHPFETGFDFRPIHVYDPELLERCLRELQRTDWRVNHGEGLGKFLQLIGYHDGSAEEWEALVLDVARAFRPACGHSLLPPFPALAATQPKVKSRGRGKAVQELLQKLENLPTDPTRCHRAVEAVNSLQTLLAKHKQERGLISFEDMLTRLASALDPAQNPRATLLLAALRRRYHFAIIDEFQDTDPLQWRIFKRIFVEGNGPQRLFVVGDPKQAIFGFLGADVQAFLQAVDELTKQHDAETNALGTNWRTCPELLRPLNDLFGDKGQWFKGTGITYTPVEATKEPVHRMVKDNSKRAALTLVDVRADDSLGKARWTYARFVAAEIQRLLYGHKGKALLEIQKKEDLEPRPLRANDICILVRSRREADPILRCLGDRHIVYSFYKQPGLWQSNEAIQLAYLLQALARPDELSSLRKALLTIFFRLRPEELSGRDELAEDLPAVRLFRTWCDLANRRRWGELFHSLLEDSGVLFAGINDAGYERRLANFQHLFGFLERAGYGQGLDLVGVIGVLGEKARRASGDEETNLQPIETERAKVRIMTIHAAKGDEYPIVFMAGGFTIAKQDRTPTWYRYCDEQQNRVINLQTKDNDQAKEKHKAELASEDRRLIYVTLTRSMFKLYLPRVKTKGYKGGWDGALSKIVVPAIEATKLESMGLPYVDLIGPTLPVARGKQGGAEAETNVPTVVLSGELFPVVDVAAIRQRGIRVRSYSTLRKAHLPAPENMFADRPVRDDDDDDQPDVLDDPGLLRGTVFGDLVHDTVEVVDFRAIAAASEPQALLTTGPVRGLLEEVFLRHAGNLPSSVIADRETGLLQVAKVVWNALRTPLEPLGSPLCELPPEDRLHELEFHFPEIQPGEVGSPAHTEGFLMGFMDLVFRKSGRYYLLDWKTNDLHGDYSPTALAACMAESDYERQYRLYLVALCRWLMKRIANFDFTRHIGGVYYLFMRGMNGKDQSGVFYREPRSQELDLRGILQA